MKNKKPKGPQWEGWDTSDECVRVCACVVDDVDWMNKAAKGLRSYRTFTYTYINFL